MGENIEGKRPKDLTPEERKAFFDGLRARIGDDGLKAVTEFWALMDNIISAVEDNRFEMTEEHRNALKEAFVSYFAEIAKNSDLASLTTEEMANVIASLNEPQEPFDEDLFMRDFWPMLNAPLTNNLKLVTSQDLSINAMGTATATLADGTTITVSNYSKLKGALGVSTNKILDTGVAFLGAINYYKSDRMALKVYIPLIEYGEANGYHVTPDKMSTHEEQLTENRRAENRLERLKDDIRRDLKVLASASISGAETRGKKRGNLHFSYLISGYGIEDNKIYITFAYDLARHLIDSAIMQFPVVLLRIDGRKPNAYSIGYKIALHNGNYNNITLGTANTLSVASLLDSAPEIPTIESVAQQRASWKRRIKQPLEAALDELTPSGVGYLSRWEYRHPFTGKTYTSASADALTWDEYARLMVDFIVKTEPERGGLIRWQDKKQKAIAKAEERREKAAIAAASGEKSKRGRPRKTEGIK